MKSGRLGSFAKQGGDAASWGVALGVLGAVVGFNVSSLVQFNFGDGEVAMTFWLLTGLAFGVRRLTMGMGSSAAVIAAAAGGPLEAPIQALPGANW